MKPALGRDLGTLLGNQGSASVAPEAAAAPASQPGPGVRSLLRGHRSEPATSQTPASAPIQPVLPLNTGGEQPVQPTPAVAPSTPSKPIIPPWYLFAADVLVVALAVVLVFKGGTISWGQRFFYMILVALGGCLGIGGVLLSDKGE